LGRYAPLAIPIKLYGRLDNALLRGDREYLHADPLM